MTKQMCSEKITNLAKAMVEVQKQLRSARKDSFDGVTQSKYATLNSVMEACGEAFIDAGIWVTQYPVPVEGGGKLLGLITKLVHAESREWQESLLVMPLSKNDPQGHGSALTYARRYRLSSMVGLVTEDDDANTACKSQDLQNLPRIDGVSYQQQKAKDGAFYITTIGNIRDKNSILKENGFKWNSSKKPHKVKY